MSETTCKLTVRTRRSSVISRAIFCLSFIILASRYVSHWPSTHHLFSSSATGVGSSFRGAGTNSELGDSSNEAAWSFSPNPVADFALDPAAWAD
ncbi:hypothetical protein H5410_028135 [Solanum commersonii]|uniref:Uncharacterized protein n=1 Tax=Solanum commersonii TaxID=4109 RepID=A0A9J5Z132_SOLCO|nr:hypothetical protein H5410_028135 [Solanum commersonii]